MFLYSCFALMQIAIWFLFRHNRTFIMQLSSSEMINHGWDFISKKVTSLIVGSLELVKMLPR
jgi:hypothetical protein